MVSLHATPTLLSPSFFVSFGDPVCLGSSCILCRTSWLTTPRYSKPGYWRASKPASNFPRRASQISKLPLGASRVFSEPSRRPTGARSSQPLTPLGVDTPPLVGQFSLSLHSSPSIFLFFSFGHRRGRPGRGTRLLCKGAMSCLLRPRLTAAYIALHESGRLDRLEGRSGCTAKWGA